MDSALNVLYKLQNNKQTKKKRQEKIVHGSDLHTFFITHPP